MIAQIFRPVLKAGQYGTQVFNPGINVGQDGTNIPNL